MTSKPFIPNDMTISQNQLDVLRTYLDARCDDYAREHEVFVAHLLRSYLSDPWKYRDGVPVECRLIESLSPNRKRPSAEKVWGPLAEAGVIEATPYDRHAKRSRAYRVAPDLVDAFAAAGVARDAQEAARWRWWDVRKGRETKAKAKTAKSTSSNHRVGSQLWRDAIGSLREGRLNVPAVLTHLRSLKAEADAAREAWESEGSPEFVSGVEEAIDASGIRENAGAVAALVEAWEKENGEPRTEAYREYQRLRFRYLNDASCLTALLRQRGEETDQPGIFRYRLAYRHQTSGRAGQIGGGLQSCSREMKAANYRGLGESSEVPDVRNYDLVASQPSFLVELFEEANEMGGGELDKRPLDPSWMVAYLKAGSNAKEGWARRVGVSVKTWKTVLISLLMGATLPKKPEASDGSVVRCLRENEPSCSTPQGLAKTFRKLADALRPLEQEIRRWHRWTDSALVERVGVTCGKTERAVHNAAGETYIWDREAPAHRRRRELAAHLLQGKEAAFILHLIGLADDHGFEVIAHEHDGLVTIGSIPEEAVEEAARCSGVKAARLVEKPFADPESRPLTATVQGEPAAGTSAVLRLQTPMPNHRSQRKQSRIKPSDYTVDPATGCHVWNGWKDPDGYGRKWINGKKEGAHRVAWEDANGRRVSRGKVIAHSCDNPPCVNPAHLDEKTQRANIADRQARDRQAKGMRNGRAKLTRQQVAEAKRDLAAGTTTIAQRARELGVDYGTIRDIESGKNWSHVTPAPPT